MLSAIRTALVGRSDVELHFERFAAPPVVDGREFPVTVASTGQTVAVGADETLLAGLRRAGCTRRTPVSRASAARAAPACSPVRSITATRCSPIRNGPRE